MSFDAGTVGNHMAWRPTRVLVPVDPYAESQRAVPLGAAIADHLGLPLQLFGWHWQQDEVKQLRRLVTELANGMHPVPEVRVVGGGATSLAGPLVDAAQNQEGTLVCMATHARSSVGAAVFGSVTEALIRATADPVVLVGPHLDDDRPGLSAPVVVCVDGSELSELAVPVAAAWATAVGTSLEIIYVQQATDGVESGYVARLATESGVDASWEVLPRRRPAAAIVDHARGRASLLALATNGRSGLARVVAGSVTKQVVREAPCPVLLVPPLSGQSGS